MTEFLQEVNCEIYEPLGEFSKLLLEQISNDRPLTFETKEHSFVAVIYSYMTRVCIEV